MDNTITNQNSTFTSINSTWNLEKMEHILHDHQLGLDSVWPNYPLQIHQIPSTSSSSSTIVPSSSSSSSSFLINDILGIHLEEEEEPEEELGAMKEMMYKIAAMQPVDIDPATIRRPKRRNVRISDDPQSVAARHRRERISEKIRVLQRLVPGGTKMDTASMLDEAIRYVKFLKRQIRLLQSTPHSPHPHPECSNINATTASSNLAPLSDWPFAPPSMLHSSTASSSMVTPARFGFNAGDGSGFIHEVISD